MNNKGLAPLIGFFMFLLMVGSITYAMLGSGARSAINDATEKAFDKSSDQTKKEIGSWSNYLDKCKPCFTAERSCTTSLLRACEEMRKNIEKQ